MATAINPKRAVGRELADDDLERLDRRRKQQLHRAVLPLARDGQGREQNGKDRHHDDGQSGITNQRLLSSGLNKKAGAQLVRRRRDRNARDSLVGEGLDRRPT